MKEADRKLQWCPHRRTTVTIDPVPGPPVTTVTVAGNSLISPTPPFQVEIGTCIGSICSQWRWESDDLERVYPNAVVLAAATWHRGPDGQLERDEPVRPIGLPVAYLWRPLLLAWTRAWIAGDREGHCGISGPAPFG